MSLPSVTGQVVKYLQVNIENGIWPVGTKLPSESQLCAALGVSRTSVRSALQQFIAIGAVESIHGKGSFVRSADLSRLLRSDPYSYETFQQVLQACAIIRPTVCVAALELGDSQLVPDLRKILDRMHALNPSQISEMMDLVQEFHSRFSTALKNDILDDIRCRFNTVLSHFKPSRGDNVLFYGNLYYHNSMLEAIEHQDTEALITTVYNYYSNVNNFYRFSEHTTSNRE